MGKTTLGSVECTLGSLIIFKYFGELNLIVLRKDKTIYVLLVRMFEFNYKI